MIKVNETRWKGGGRQEKTECLERAGGRKTFEKKFMRQVGRVGDRKRWNAGAGGKENIGEKLMRQHGRVGTGKDGC